jgi:hypothetical protein
VAGIEDADSKVMTAHKRSTSRKDERRSTTTRTTTMRTRRTIAT